MSLSKISGFNQTLPIVATLSRWFRYSCVALATIRALETYLSRLTLLLIAKNLGRPAQLSCLPLTYFFRDIYW